MSQLIHQILDTATVLWPSFLMALAVAISASFVGVFVLLRREGLAALAMPQIVAIGAAIGLRMRWPGLPPALAAVVVAVLLLVWSKRRGYDHWLLPSLYIAGLSFSFIIIANAGAHVEEMQAMFTGIDVAVAPESALIASPILLIAGAICALLWRRWLVLSQSPAVAEAAGVNPARWEIAFLTLLAIVLVLGTANIGAVMVIAMLFLPAATVLPWVRRIPTALAAAVVIAVLILLGGLVLSVQNDWQFSQSVGAVGFGLLIISQIAARIMR